MSDFDEQYRGPAYLQAGDLALALDVHLSAQFEPVEGRYRWAGRAVPDEALLARLRSGAKDVTVRIGAGPAVAARLGEPDPWGRVRLTGTGRPPWGAGSPLG